MPATWAGMVENGGVNHAATNGQLFSPATTSAPTTTAAASAPTVRRAVAAPRTRTAAPTPARSPKCCVHFVGRERHDGQRQQQRHDHPPLRTAAHRHEHRRRGQQRDQHGGPAADRALEAVGQQLGVALRLLVPGRAAADQRPHAGGFEHRAEALVVDHEQHRRRRPRDQCGDHRPSVQVGAGAQEPQHRPSAREERGERDQAAGRERRRGAREQEAQHERQQPAGGHRALDEEPAAQEARRHPRLGPQPQAQRHPPGGERERREPRLVDAEPGEGAAGQQSPGQEAEQGGGQAHPQRARRYLRPRPEQVVEPAERRLRGVEPAVDVADEAVLAAAADDARDVAVVDGDRSDDPPEAEQRGDGEVDEAGTPPAPPGAAGGGRARRRCGGAPRACPAGRAPRRPRPRP